MKSKLLLLTLAGAALTACTQDDEFVLSNGEADVQSPITFTVNMDEDMTRAIWDGPNKNILTLEVSDLISMYQGMKHDKIVLDVNDQTKNAAFYGESYANGRDYGNVIFRGEGDENTAMNLIPLNEVNAGGAFMMYPADTLGFWKKDVSDQQLYVTIESDQKNIKRKGKEYPYSTFLPLVTDYMNIKPYTGQIDDNNTAGFGRNYDVRFKQLGALFRLALVAKEQAEMKTKGLTDIEFKSVKIDAKADVFNTKLAVAAIKTESTLKNFENSEGKKLYEKHFVYQTNVNTAAPAGTSQYVSTNDIALHDGEMAARFVLLPRAYDDQNPDNILADNAVITIETNYGTVVLVNDASTTPTTPIAKHNSKTEVYTIQKGLSEVLNNTYREKTTDGAYKGAYSGTFMRRTLNFSLKDIELNTTVKNSAELLNLLEFYNLLEREDVLTIKLRGENNLFELKPEALTAILDGKLIAADKIKINGGSVSDNSIQTIILKDGGNDERIAEFASIPLEKTASQIPYAANLALEGVWNLTAAADFSTVRKSVTIAKDATLNLTGKAGEVFGGAKEIILNGALVIAGAGNEAQVGKLLATKDISKDNAYTSTITLAANTTLYINGDSDIYGDITIGDRGALSVLDNTTTIYGSVSNSGIIGFTPSSGAKLFCVGEITNEIVGTQVNLSSLENLTNGGIINTNQVFDRITLGTLGKGLVKYNATSGIPTTGWNANINYAIFDNAGDVNITSLPVSVKNLEFNGNANIIYTGEDPLALNQIFVNGLNVTYKAGNKNFSAVRAWINDRFTVNKDCSVLQATAGVEETYTAPNFYGEETKYAGNLYTVSAPIVP